ncbi:MAG: YjfB family protein [Pseudomonadota bacterium]
MDVTSIASLATQMSAAQTMQEVQASVLKKAMDLQEQTAARLIESIPRPALASGSLSLGQNVDLYA